MVAGKSPDWLPAGWTEHVKVKDSRKYKFYLDPLTGRKFYSKPQVNEYLISQQKNMDTVSPNMGELTTGGKTSPNLEASQFRTRSSSKQNQMGIKQSVEKPNGGELTGGMTSLKQEEPQKVKTPKRTSRKSVPKQMNSSMQPVEKVVIERATPDGLPPGWLKEQLQYYTDPVSGYVFFSREDVSRYLESGDINSCTVRPKKRDELGFLNQETSPNTGELTRAKTSQKLEGFQNKETLKQSSCTSNRKQMSSTKQPVEKVVIERVAPDGLPPGWLKEIKIQKKAKGTRKDTYYTDPVSGYVFVSQKDVSRYLESGDVNRCSVRPKKRDELGFFNEDTSVSPNMVESTGGKNSLKQGGYQNVETPKRKSRVSKQKQIGFSKQSAEKPAMGELTESKTPLKQEGSEIVETPMPVNHFKPAVIELTGGQTSQEVEGSQNVKTQKRKSGPSKKKQMTVSEQSVEKVVIERVTPAGLPPGWIKEIRIQMKENGTRKDPYYTDPVSGYVFLSQKDALRYLETGDLSSCAMKPRKRAELRFLNQQSSIQSAAITPELGHHTPKRQLFAGTQGTVSDAPQKKQRILKGKQSLDNAIEECADTKEGYDPSSSPMPTTKGSKRKRGRKVGAQNGTISTPSTEKGTKGSKSSRKTQVDSSKSLKKKEPKLPSRSSKRLVELKSESLKPGESDAQPSVGPLDNVDPTGPQQFQTVLNKEIADHIFGCTEEAPSNVDQAVSENQSVREETEKKEEENQDHEKENPFEDSWSDPCLDFAFKTLSGEMPVEDNPQPTLGSFQHSPSPQTGGCLSLLDFGAPNFFQNKVVTDFNAPEKPVSAPEKPVSDSVTQLPNSPTFLHAEKFQASANLIPPGFDAAAKQVPDFLIPSPNDPTFLASANLIPPGFDTPWKPVSNTVSQLPNIPTFLASGNVSSPNCSGNASQQPNLDGNAEHRPNLNL